MSLPGIIAGHIWCHVGHLQVAGIDVVQDDGTVLGFTVVTAQLLELFGDVGDPPLGNPPYSGYRGRMPGIGEQGDLGAVGRAALEGGLQELPQAFGWAGLMVQFFDQPGGSPVDVAP